MHPLNVTTRLRQRDDGMSLMEVVVAVVLLGVLSTLVVSLVLQAQAPGPHGAHRDQRHPRVRQHQEPRPAAQALLALLDGKGGQPRTQDLGFELMVRESS